MMSEVCHDPLIATVMDVTTEIAIVMEVTKSAQGSLRRLPGTGNCNP
jgi:hypothetical protein